MARSGKAASGDESKPRVHVTATGGRYVKAEELLRNAEVRKAIENMAQIATGEAEKETSEPSSKDE